MSTVRVEINGRTYATQREASDDLGVKPGVLRTRLDSDEYPEYIRIQPKRTLPPGQVRFMVTTSVDKMEMFDKALDVMHTDRDSYIDSCIKNAILNSLTLVEEYDHYGASHDYDVAQATQQVLEAWKPKRGGGIQLPADTEM